MTEKTPKYGKQKVTKLKPFSGTYTPPEQYNNNCRKLTPEELKAMKEDFRESAKGLDEKIVELLKSQGKI